MFRVQVLGTQPLSNGLEDRVGLIKLVRAMIQCSLLTAKHIVDGDTTILVNGQELETITRYDRAKVHFKIEVVPPDTSDPFQEEIMRLEHLLAVTNRDLDFLLHRRNVLLHL
jgi:hypothetical protein